MDSSKTRPTLKWLVWLQKTAILPLKVISYLFFRCARVFITLTPHCLATRTVASQKWCSMVKETWSWTGICWSQVGWWRMWRLLLTLCYSRRALMLDTCLTSGLKEINVWLPLDGESLCGVLEQVSSVWMSAIDGLLQTMKNKQFQTSL